MYKRAEAVKIKQSFWTTFGRYMAPLPNSEGLKINWINYHTGFRQVYFRMDADRETAQIFIALTQGDEVMRLLFFERLQQMRLVLNEYLEEEWNWETDVEDSSGKHFARISKNLEGVNVYNQDDWPAIISFLKPRIMGLDRFWNDVKDAFEDFR